MCIRDRFQPERLLAAARGDAMRDVHARLEPRPTAAAVPAPAPKDSPLESVRAFSLADQEWRLVVSADPVSYTHLRPVLHILKCRARPSANSSSEMCIRDRPCSIPEAVCRVGRPR